MDTEIGLINVLTATGLTILIVYGEPIRPIREYIGGIANSIGRLLNCTLCTGFWVGVGFGAASGDWRWPFVAAVTAWMADAVHTFFSGLSDLQK